MIYQPPASNIKSLNNYIMFCFALRDVVDNFSPGKWKHPRSPQRPLSHRMRTMIQLYRLLIQNLQLNICIYRKKVKLNYDPKKKKKKN